MHLSWVSVTLRLVGHIGVIAVLFVAAGFEVSWRGDLMNCTVSGRFRMSGGETVAFSSGSSDWVLDGFVGALCYMKYHGRRFCFESLRFSLGCDYSSIASYSSVTSCWVMGSSGNMNSGLRFWCGTWLVKL